MKSTPPFVALVFLLLCTVGFADQDKEKRIQKQLDRNISLELKAGDTFGTLIEKIERLVEIDIALRVPGCFHESALKTPVVVEDVKYEGIKLRSALRLILSDSEMTYAIKNGCLEILPEEDAPRRGMWVDLHLVRSEVELEERLERLIAIGVDEKTTFEKLFDLLLDKYGIQSAIDPKGAGALGITSSSPVVREPIPARVVPLRQFLRLVLDEQDLAYVNREGILFITSEDGAKKYMNTKVYNVADLVLPEKAVRDDKSICFTTDWDKTAKADFSELMDLIEAVVAPDSWDEGGEMMEYYPGLNLVVRQTDAVHEEIEKLLDDLRRKRRIPYMIETADHSKTENAVQIATPSPPTRSTGNAPFERRRFRSRGW